MRMRGETAMGIIIKIVVSVAVLLLCFRTPSASAKRGGSDWYKRTQISGTLTGVSQSSFNNADSSTGTSDRTNMAMSVDLKIKTKIASGHSIIVRLEGGEGASNPIDPPSGATSGGVTLANIATINPNYDNHTNTVFTNSDGTSQTSSAIAEAYYEGRYLRNRLAVSIGKMDIHSMYDQNKLAGDETEQFLAGIFVRSTGTVFNELKGYYAPGLKLMVSPTRFIGLSYVGAYQYENSASSSLNVLQLNFKVGKTGNYRIYGIYDLRSYTKVTSGAIVTSASGAITANIGYGLSFDQMITENIGVFVRYATQQADINENKIQSSFSGGLHLNGALWRRRNDSIGIGYGLVTNNKSIASPSKFSGQTLLETYYRLEIAKGFAFTADLQMHDNLDRVNNRTVYLAGLRLNARF